MKNLLLIFAIAQLAFCSAVVAAEGVFDSTVMVEKLGAFMLDSQGNQWIGTEIGAGQYSGGILVKKPDGTVVKFLNLEMSVTALTLTDNEDSLLVGTDQGIFKSDVNLAEKQWLPHYEGAPLMSRQIIFYQGSYWVFNILLYKDDNTRITGKLFFLKKGNLEWVDKKIAIPRGMVLDKKNGNVWVSAFSFYKYNALTGTRELIPLKYNNGTEPGCHFAIIAIDSLSEYIYTRGNGGIYKIAVDDPINNYRIIYSDFIPAFASIVLGDNLWTSIVGVTGSCRMSSLNITETNPEGYLPVYYLTEISDEGLDILGGLNWHNGTFYFAVYPHTIVSFRTTGGGEKPKIRIVDSTNTLTTATINWEFSDPANSFKEYRFYWSVNGGAFQPAPDDWEPIVLTDPEVSTFTIDYFNPVLDSLVTLKVVAISNDGNAVADEVSFTIPRTVGYGDGTGFEGNFGPSKDWAFTGDLFSFSQNTRIENFLFFGRPDSNEVWFEIRPKNNPNESGLKILGKIDGDTGPKGKWHSIRLKPEDHVYLVAGEYYIGVTSDGVSSANVYYSTQSNGSGYFIKNSGGELTLNTAHDYLIRVGLNSDITGVEAGSAPEKFILEQNYPNPFNPTTTIRYSIPKLTDIKITIYDILGREIQTLVDTQQVAGEYKFTWDAQNVPTGVYFCKLVAGEATSIKKMLLVK